MFFSCVYLLHLIGPPSEEDKDSDEEDKKGLKRKDDDDDEEREEERRSERRKEEHCSTWVLTIPHCYLCANLKWYLQKKTMIM